jgi:hypothetical protein
MTSEGMPREERRRATTRQWSGPERRSHFAASAGGQLLERGQGVADPVGSLGDDTDLFSTEGEAGTNIGGRYGGPAHEIGGNPNRGDEPDGIDGGTGGEGGFGTLAGGISKGEGSSDDAPNYGDWVRHSTGTTSGATGHEGYDFEGEGTWGESERDRERAEPTDPDTTDPDSTNSTRGDR